MAAAVPAKIKAAAPDVQRFVRRAAELGTFRPIVTYWCEYYVLQQVLNRSLHTADEECTNYAVELMDKLESYKALNASNDAVIDDVAAKAYVENFALETFARGDEAQRTNTVKKQTADTFQAAGTFLDLLAIWGPLDQEMTAKSKFAKYHALRIAKAIKAGEDPNATNPIIEPPAQPEATTEDRLDAELRDLERQTGTDVEGYKAPTVEDTTDNVPLPAETIHGPTVSDATDQPYAPLDSERSQGHDVSPIEPPEDGSSRTGSVGGGYFPSVPLTVSAPPSEQTGGQVTQPQAQFPPSNPVDFYHTAPEPSLPTGPKSISTTSNPRSHEPISAIQVQPTTAPPPGGYRNDDESILTAQKHAKWAISALNFEDIETAVKELRIALHSLGAS